MFNQWIIVQYLVTIFGSDFIYLCDNNVDKMKRKDEFWFLGKWQFWTFSCGYDFAEIGTEREVTFSVWHKKS